MPASHFVVKPVTGRPKFIVRHSIFAVLSRYQNAAAVSREYAERFPERHHPGPR
jgi:hypothetical protein